MNPPSPQSAKNGWGLKYRMFDSTPPGVMRLARLKSCADPSCLARYLRLNRWDGMEPPPPWAPAWRGVGVRRFGGTEARSEFPTTPKTALRGSRLDSPRSGILAMAAEAMNSFRIEVESCELQNPGTNFLGPG